MNTCLFIFRIISGFVGCILYVIAFASMEWVELEDKSYYGLFHYCSNETIHYYRTRYSDCSHLTPGSSDGYYEAARTLACFALLFVVVLLITLRVFVDSGLKAHLFMTIGAAVTDGMMIAVVALVGGCYRTDSRWSDKIPTLDYGFWMCVAAAIVMFITAVVFFIALCIDDIDGDCDCDCDCPRPKCKPNCKPCCRTCKRVRARNKIRNREREIRETRIVSNSRDVRQSSDARTITVTGGNRAWIRRASNDSDAAPPRNEVRLQLSKRLPPLPPPAPRDDPPPPPPPPPPGPSGPTALRPPAPRRHMSTPAMRAGGSGLDEPPVYSLPVDHDPQPMSPPPSYESIMQGTDGPPGVTHPDDIIRQPIMSRRVP